MIIDCSWSLLFTLRPPKISIVISLEWSNSTRSFSPFSLSLPRSRRLLSSGSLPLTIELSCFRFFLFFFAINNRQPSDTSTSWKHRIDFLGSLFVFKGQRGNSKPRSILAPTILSRPQSNAIRRQSYAIIRVFVVNMHVYLCCCSCCLIGWEKRRERQRKTIRRREMESWIFLLPEKDHYTYLFGCDHHYPWIDGRRVAWL